MLCVQLIRRIAQVGCVDLVVSTQSNEMTLRMLLRRPSSISGLLSSEEAVIFTYAIKVGRCRYSYGVHVIWRSQ